MKDLEKDSQEVSLIKKIQCMKEEEDLIYQKRERGMDFADFGITVNVHSNFVNSSMKSLLFVGSRRGLEIHPPAGFFTKSLNQLRKISNTEKRNFHHSNKEDREKEINEEGKKENQNK
jgi:hypothetical protein